MSMSHQMMMTVFTVSPWILEFSLPLRYVQSIAMDDP